MVGGTNRQPEGFLETMRAGASDLVKGIKEAPEQIINAAKAAKTAFFGHKVTDQTGAPEALQDTAGKVSSTAQESIRDPYVTNYGALPPNLRGSSGSVSVRSSLRESQESEAAYDADAGDDGSRSTGEGEESSGELTLSDFGIPPKERDPNDEGANPLGTASKAKTMELPDKARGDLDLEKYTRVPIFPNSPQSHDGIPVSRAPQEPVQQGSGGRTGTLDSAERRLSRQPSPPASRVVSSVNPEVVAAKPSLSRFERCLLATGRLGKLLFQKRYVIAKAKAHPDSPITAYQRIPGLDDEAFKFRTAFALPDSSGTAYGALPAEAMVTAQKAAGITGSANRTGLEPPEFNEQEVVVGKSLGNGAFGVVRKVTLPNGQIGAMKQVGKPDNPDDVALFNKEVETLIATQGTVGIPKLLGVVMKDGILCPILEFCEGGDLLGKLREQEEIPVLSMMTWASDIAEGVAALHEKDLIHRDLAARNVLLKGAGGAVRANVSDLGLSEFVEKGQDSGTTKSVIGPLKHMAPEALMRRIYSEKTDVWSFGVTMCELFNRGDAYPDLEPLQVVHGVTSNGLIPRTGAIFARCGQEMGTLVLRCFAFKPEERPTMKEVLETIRQIAAKHERRLLGVLPLMLKDLETPLNAPLPEVTSSNEQVDEPPAPGVNTAGYGNSGGGKAALGSSSSSAASGGSVQDLRKDENAQPPPEVLKGMPKAVAPNAATDNGPDGVQGTKGRKRAPTQYSEMEPAKPPESASSPQGPPSVNV